MIAPNVFHVLPLSVETWKVREPVGVMLNTLGIVTVPLTCVPRVMGLAGFSVGAGTVGFAGLTVKAEDALVVLT